MVIHFIPGLSVFIIKFKFLKIDIFTFLKFHFV
jgi:hypothetical protein